jgi:para-aminobenzoate synthetase
VLRTVLIDNHDSFTFNLHQLLAQINGVEPLVVTNDQLPWEELAAREVFDNVVVSPGPGTPERPRDLGISADAIAAAACPVLGVCLGHQAIAHHLGGRVTHAPAPMHGRRSEIFHDGRDLFAGLPSPFSAVRYHSLLVADLPDTLEPTAWTRDGLLMGLRHRARPLWGVQFHPESICTEHGRALLANFADLTRRHRPARAGAAIARRRAFSAPQAPPEELHLVARRLELSRDPEVAFVTLFADRPGAFWLDSARRGPGVARFSYMGDATGPRARSIRAWASERRISIREGARETTREGDVLDEIERELRAVALRGDAVPFELAGGYVGYLGYEALGGARASDAPDAAFVRADRLVVFDHQEDAIWIACCAPQADLAAARAWIDQMEAELRALPAEAPLDPLDRPRPARLHLRHEPAAYLAGIDRCQALLRDGESYEMCLTNQLEADVDVDPLRFYRVLRRRNPAPYAAYLRVSDDLTIACSSPELYLAVDRRGRVESRPMKGTARRCADSAEDEETRRALEDDEKTRSENLMIVDLVRNDLGRVCAVGSVEVPGLMRVETYATVHQMISVVVGQLDAGRSAVDAVRASFPGGSMTGAPKVRTMQMLAELEQGPRGIYSGALGFFGLDGAARLNIVIRTAVIRPGKVTIGTGGAIVALSDPAAELEETYLKLEALVGALAEATGNEPEALRRALRGAAEEAR